MKRGDPTLVHRCGIATQIEVSLRSGLSEKQTIYEHMRELLSESTFMALQFTMANHNNFLSLITTIYLSGLW